MSEKPPIPFRGFDEQAALRIYDHGILPHWRQAGCTYFVTFCLVDSIPANVIAEMEYERSAWLRAHGIDSSQPGWKSQLAKLPSKERRIYEDLIAARFDRALDGSRGRCILRLPGIGRLVAASLDHFHNSRVWTGDYVIMPNHVHALLTPLPEFELENLLHSIKSYTANAINRALSESGPVWQRESHDHIVRDLDQLQAYQDYIAANPRKANLANGDYVCSSARYVALP